MKKIFESIKQLFNGICLIDKILMAYMGILLVYIAVHLICAAAFQESNSVDTIIRTSASAIFGYFISNNFIRSNSDTESKNKSVSNAAKPFANEYTAGETDIQNQPDFKEDNIKNTAANASVCCSRLQIIVVSAIGFIALVLLLISKNYTQTTPEFSATVSQLRDFLSASIGFLVSCGKSK